jgi:hypothetical protein
MLGRLNFRVECIGADCSGLGLPAGAELAREEIEALQGEVP